MEPVHPEAPVLRAEIQYAASHEGALRLEDVLLRRTRLAFVTRDGARSVAADVAGIVAPLLGWDEQRSREEVEAFIEVSPRVPAPLAP